MTTKIYLISAEKPVDERVVRAFYYAAESRRWTTHLDATRYTDKKLAEHDLAGCGLPTRERGWKKSILTVSLPAR